MTISKISSLLISLILIFIPLYPKFPLLDVSGSFVAVRLDDFAVVLVVGLFSLTHLGLKRSQLFAPLPRAVYLFLFTGFVALFSGIFLTKSAGFSLGLLHALRRVEYLSLFFVGLFGLTELKDLSFFTRVIIFTSLVVALFGLGQQFFNFPVITTTNSEFAKGLALSLGPGARINSTFAGHYDLAAYSVFPLLLILALLAQKPKHAWLLFAIGALVYWSLLLSASRTTFVSFFVVAGLLAIIVRKKWWLVPLGLAAIVSVLVSPQLRGRYLDLVTNYIHLSLVPVAYAQTPVSKDVSQAVPDALKAPAQPEDRSFSIRLQAEWPTSFRAILTNPVFGTGYSSVGLAVDNDYLRSLAETGVIGFAAFMLIFIRFFKTSLPFIRNYQPDLEHAFIIAITLSVFSLLMNAVFIDIFEASKMAIFCWLVMGLAEKTKLLYEK